MNHNVLILPQAIADVADAIAWYQQQRDGLGAEFDQAFDSAATTISQFPKLYPIAFGSVRRCLLGRFPYGIFYEVVDDGVVLIVAVLHASRDPATLQDRL